MTWFVSEVVSRPYEPVLTAEDLRQMMDQASKVRLSHFECVVSPKVFERIVYLYRSTLVWELSGYRKWCGPDGRRWIEDRVDEEQRIGIAFGGGHRAKRRLGVGPEDPWPLGWKTV